MNSRPWLNNYPARWNLEYPLLSLYDYLKRETADYGDRTALVFMGKRVTYREMFENIDRTAAAFAGLGLKKGDRVALMLPNCFAYVYCYYAAMRLGLVVVQVNPLYPARELGFVVRDSGAGILVAPDLMLPVIAETMLDRDLEKLVIVPLAGGDGDSPANATLFDDLTGPYSPGDAPEAAIEPREDLAVLQYTGGTTGFPKGAMLTHFNLVAIVEMNREFIRTWLDRHSSRDDIFTIALLPFFQSYGMTCCLNACLAVGSGLVLVPQFNADMILDLIKEYRPLLFPAVPKVYLALMNHPAADRAGLESIEICISGAAPMPVESIEQFEIKTGSSLLEGYGLSETASVTHCNPLVGVRKPGSIGIPYPDTECRVVDLATGEADVPCGEPGELIISGPQVMQGYWNRPDDTARALRGGWLYTGDVARMDEDGYFYIIDRKKDVIVYGGYQIFPSEVEAVLYEHPKVREAICIGVPEKHFGEAVKAYITPREGAEADPGEIIEFCRNKLEKFKVPRQVEFRDRLPKNLVGKILRRELMQGEQRRRKEELLEQGDV